MSPPHSAPRPVTPEISDRADEARALAQVTEKVEAVVRLAGGVAHGFNNLLTVISGNAEGMLESEGTSAFRTELEQIADAARRAAVLTHQLLAFSRQLVLNPRATNLAHVLETAWDDLEQALGPGIRVRREVAESLGGVYVDAAQLGKVMGHLVRNAAEAMPNGGEVTITLRDEEVDQALAAMRRPMPPGAYILLEVRDSGPGMDAETLRRAMEPFYTTKGRKHGAGMGLPMVYGIVKQSGGFLWIDSTPGSGTTCQLYFPRLADPMAPARPRTPAWGDAQRGRGTILLVEDEDLVRQLAARTLVRAGYVVVEVPNAHAALVEVRERGLSPDLLLTDVVMPGMDGRELATLLERELPGMPVVLMSGFVDPRVPVRQAEGRSRLFLEKPFSLDRLRSMVRDAMQAAAPGL